jgi:hypothetical protein
MPSDITGAPLLDVRTQDFRFRPGPVFTQLLLADEIDRAPATTHAAPTGCRIEPDRRGMPVQCLFVCRWGRTTLTGHNGLYRSSDAAGCETVAMPRGQS